MSQAIDLLICAVPSRSIGRLPGALAIIRSCAEQAGFSAKTVDFNIEFLKNQCNKDAKTFFDLGRVFEPLINFEYTLAVVQWLDESIEYIKKINPRWVGISVETPYQHRATILLAHEIRKHLPQIKIVMGAYGLTAESQNSLLNFPNTKSIDLLNNFDCYIRKHNLADELLHDDPENEIVTLLSQGQITNLFPVTKNSFESPVPNYDDYDLENYQWPSRPLYAITGSKSCVRSCKFCSIPDHFGRYRVRTGESIANEMIELNKRYGARDFIFTDSLVNGSQKVFFDWIKILASYNQTKPDNQKISWIGQYICKPQKSIDPELYPLMKLSGVGCLTIGAESGSDEVLAAMDKNITAKDIEDELEQLNRHQIQSRLLIFGGYYNETWERYLETLRLIARCHKYIATGNVARVAIGLPMHLEKGTRLYRMAEELNIETDPGNVFNWVCRDNPDNTFLERVRRRVISQAVLNKMKTPLTAHGARELYDIIEQLKIYEQKLRSSNSH